MHILEVIPLTNLPQNISQILTYFGDSPLKKGAVVEVAIRGRKIKAIVISSQPLEQKKILLKKSEFQLKKIESVFLEEPLVSEKQFQIALWFSRQYFAPLTLCLKSILPAFLFLKKYRLGLPQETENLESQQPENSETQKTKPLLILSNFKQLPQKLESYINDVVSNSKQTLILVPDKNEIKFFADYYKDKFALAAIFSELPNAQQFEIWKKSISGENQLIIGTRNSLVMNYKNLGLVIVCDSMDEVYRSDTTPKYFSPELAEKISELNGAKLIFADPAIGTDNLHRFENNGLIIKDEIPRSTPKIEIIDMIKEIRNGNFSIFSGELKEKLRQNIRRDKKILIFSSRKGYMGMFLCQNCGTHVSCQNCDIPMRVHRGIDFYLVCHRCSATQPLPKYCSNCNSGKMRPSGPAGSQKIFDDIRLMIDRGEIPYAPAFILDAEVIKNETEEDEALETLDTPKAAICVATQLIFSHRSTRHFDFVTVPNADALAHFSDFRAEEKFLYDMRKIIDFEPSEILLQTHNQNNALFNYLSIANPVEFYKNDLKLRESFNYPPFSRIVTLNFSHKDQQKARQAAVFLSEKLRMAAARLNALDNVIISNSSTAVISKEKGLYVNSIIIKILPSMFTPRSRKASPRDFAGPNPRDLLKYVPAGWSIEP